MLAMAALAVLVGCVNGKAGAKMLLSLARGYFKQNKKKIGFKELNEQSFRNTLSKLKEVGLVKREGWGVWRITEQGKEFLNKSEKTKREASSIVGGGRPDTIVIFDIPEKQKVKRESARIQLALLGFKMLQKSVYIGCGPLPEAFLYYLREEEILDYFHIFSIKEFGTIGV